jgi:hypothetical protein
MIIYNNHQKKIHNKINIILKNLHVNLVNHVNFLKIIINAHLYIFVKMMENVQMKSVVMIIN